MGWSYSYLSNGASVANKNVAALTEKYQDQPTINYKPLKCIFIDPPQVRKTTRWVQVMEEIVNISSFDHTASESAQLHKSVTIQVYEKSDIVPTVLRTSQWKKHDLLGRMQHCCTTQIKDIDESS